MAADERYQFDAGNGFTTGQPNFDPVWANTSDRLRFHGEEFRIIEQRDQGPKRPLKEIRHYLEARLNQAPLDRVLVVSAVEDGYEVKYRRHRVMPDKGALVISHAADLVGTPYVFGVTDCSWLTMHCLAQEGIYLPHNAAAQRADPQVIPIKKDQLQPGDLLFIHGDDHVAFYRTPDTVWDTEPHDAPAPWGGQQGVGVRVRSTLPNYYCGRENWNAIGRIIAINGVPR